MLFSVKPLKVFIKNYLIFLIGIALVISFIVYVKLFYDVYPILHTTPESLLPSTIFSLTVSLTIPTYIKEKLKIEKPRFHDFLFQIGITTSIFFTSSVVFLCFDIYPIPFPTTRWIWVWGIFFISGWVLLLIYFIIIMSLSYIGNTKKKQTKQTKLNGI